MSLWNRQSPTADIRPPSAFLPLPSPGLFLFPPAPAPEAQDHVGLHLVTPRPLRTLTITGSADLADIVAWTDTSAGSAAWHVFTVDEEGTRGWEPRSFTAKAAVTPVARVGAGEGEGGLAEVKLRFEELEGREGARVKQLKIVSAGRKKQRVEVCGWSWDGWQI